MTHRYARCSMATIVATHINPFTFTVEGTVADDGAITADLTSPAAGSLLAANNLDDLDDAATALTNLGGTATGVAVFTAANTPAAQAAIGAGETGSAVFIAATPADARTAMGAAATTLANAAGVSAALGNYADDAAAATGGVAVGALYRNGSVLMVRVV